MFFCPGPGLRRWHSADRSAPGATGLSGRREWIISLSEAQVIQLPVAARNVDRIQANDPLLPQPWRQFSHQGIRVFGQHGSCTLAGARPVSSRTFLEGVRSSLTPHPHPPPSGSLGQAFSCSAYSPGRFIDAQ